MQADCCTRRLLFRSALEQCISDFSPLTRTSRILERIDTHSIVTNWSVFAGRLVLTRHRYLYLIINARHEHRRVARNVFFDSHRSDSEISRQHSTCRWQSVSVYCRIIIKTPPMRITLGHDIIMALLVSRLSGRPASRPARFIHTDIRFQKKITRKLINPIFPRHAQKPVACFSIV